MEEIPQNEQSKKKEIKSYLQVDIKTLNRNLDGIFNYKTKQYRHVHDETDKGYFYMRNNKNDIDKKESQIFFDNSDGFVLFRTRKSLIDENKYSIMFPLLKPMKKNEFNINQLNNAAWYVIRSEKPRTEFDENENYILNENDILKFGRRKYEIIKMNINNSNNDINKEKNLIDNISQINKEKGSIFNINIESYQYSVTNENQSENHSTKEKTYKKNKKTKNSKNEKSEKSEKNANIIPIKIFIENERCRICFDVESTKDNPKLRICSCKDYIHFECLKKYNH